MEAIERKNTIKKVVILGAGYGGLQTALQLEKRLQNGSPVEVVLIDKCDHHQLITRLHELAAGNIAPQAANIPLARLLDGKAINYCQATVEGLRLDDQRVVTSVGEIPYDSLVIALGSESEFFGIPGADQNSFTLKSHQDALSIRDHIDSMVVSAASEQREDVRKSMLTFVISGGGFTGVELAGELADRLPAMAKENGIDPQHIEIVVIEAAKNILPGFPAALVARAREILTGKGVTLRVDSPIVRVEEHSVEVNGGEKIPSRTLIWAAGVRIGDLMAKAGLQTGVRGRAVVNPFLETVTHLDVYVVGDAALVVDPTTARPFAPSAQLAIKQGEHVAQNIWATIVGSRRTQFEPKLLGEVVSLGQHEGLASIHGVEFGGRMAAWLKEFTNMRYLYTVGGLGLLGNYLAAARRPASRAGQAIT